MWYDHPIYIRVCIYIHIHIYMYIYVIWRGREKRNPSRVITAKNWGWPKNPKLDQSREGLWFCSKTICQADTITLAWAFSENVSFCENHDNLNNSATPPSLLFLKRSLTLSVSCLFFFTRCVLFLCPSYPKIHVHSDGCRYPNNKGIYRPLE